MVSLSRKNAQRKLIDATSDIGWAMKTGITVSESNLNKVNSLTPTYIFFL
jgi:hypothetical protein